MTEYKFKEIESRWQKYWDDEKVYVVKEDASKPSYYVLDMFPYPSGSGLHVGHPLGYIASDIYARYKRHMGFKVLHPMGFDAFGLPAEQYAIETGKHPKDTTEENIQRYRSQLKSLGISFDWSREFKTCDPAYYKWTQWIFLQLFNAWYDLDQDKARHIDELVEAFKQSGSDGGNPFGKQKDSFSAEEWKKMSFKEQQNILMHYRLAYQADAEVNWCPELGTVLANDEVKEGRSERGGYPVYRKKMKQWFLRITAYADRLLDGLNSVDWPESLREMQKNWIGKSKGAEIKFEITTSDNKQFLVTTFTTRPDTVFGATYLVLAPEYPDIDSITTDDRHESVKDYINKSKQKTQRERLVEATNFTGVFTGAYATHPFTNEKLPVWIADYVLGEYGTGAIMSVPAHDSRDYSFAEKFDLPIKQVVKPETGETEGCYEAKSGILINSEFLDGLPVDKAIEKAISALESADKGRRKTSYRLRDANFSRQRYWGEPFPIIYDDDVPVALPESELPVQLPPVDTYKPTGDGRSPLARNEDWVKHPSGKLRETDTMPASAGSSWYFLRFMDPHNDKKPFDPEKEKFWQKVDLYVGGAEHATGHLIYSRFWHKFLNDFGWVSTNEPFKKLVNQGKILGRSSFVYRVKGQNRFISKNLIKNYDTTPIHVDIRFVNENDELDLEAFKKWRPEFATATFELEDGKYICGSEIEKMSKSKYNVVNPDDVIGEHGTDAFRLHEMFLGPVEDSKMWDISGIDGVNRFLRRFWKLYYPQDTFTLSDEKATKDELKVLHKTIKRLKNDLERFSMNTCISGMMECVNELTRLKCNKREILEPLIILIAPFTPYLSEELWHKAGHSSSVTDAPFPEFDESQTQDDQIEYPISVNGKLRAKLPVPAGTDKDIVQEKALELPDVRKWIDGKDVKKIIVVPKRIVNIVVK